MQPALRVANLSKTFGGSRALNDFALSVERGRIHGLLGQNGCGKSTFVKLLAGFHEPDPGGQVEVYGHRLSLPASSATLRSSGLCFVHQNLGLVPTLTVLENLRIDALTSRHRWRIDWSVELRMAQEALARVGVDIDPKARMASLAPIDRALVAITRALESARSAQSVAGVPGILVLDEPTPFLPRASVEKLFGLLRRVVADGASVILISHDIDEILEITDGATVLRDGQVAGQFVTAEASRDSIIELIVGRRLPPYQRHVARSGAGARGVSVANLVGQTAHALNIDVGAGEIVGLTGLAGAGYEDVLRYLFGAARPVRGTLRLGAQQIDLARLQPGTAIGAGIAFLPGDRLGASGIGSLPLADNVCVLSLPEFSRRSFLQRSRMLAHAAQAAHRYQVRPPRPDLPLSAFSGGNAQKALLAKWLHLRPSLLLLEEPTQGVDVGARQNLWRAIRSAAENGASVLCSSSDHEQLASLCDRVLVFRQGRIIAELKNPGMTKELIAARCYGQAPQEMAS